MRCGGIGVGAASSRDLQHGDKFVSRLEAAPTIMNIWVDPVCLTSTAWVFPGGDKACL